MTRAAVFALIEEILNADLTIVAYCRARGWRPGTVVSRALRAGVSMGIEIRRRRVERVYAIKRDYPEFTWSRAAAEGGFDTLSRFQRCRRSLVRRGIAIAPMAEPTSEERIGNVLHQARKLAAVAETVLASKPFLGLKIALADYRRADWLLERASVKVGAWNDAH